MIIFLPVIFLILGGTATIILKAVLPKFRYAWMIVTGTVFTSWVTLLLLPAQSLKPFIITNWSPLSTYQLSLSFAINPASWQIAFLLTSLVLGGILSSVIDGPDANPDRSWSTILFLTAFGLMAILSSDPVSLLILWSILDFFELLSAMRSSNIAGGRISIVNFCAHLIATMIALWIFCINLQGRKIPGFEILTADGLLLVLFAVLLRFLPITEFPKQEETHQNAHRTISTLISITISFCLLLKIDAWPSMNSTISLILWLAVIFSIYCVLRFTRSKVLQTRLRTLAALLLAFTIIAIFSGKVLSVSNWIGYFLIVGSLVFYFSSRTKGLMWIGVLIGFVTSGIPFSPFQSIWSGYNAAGIFPIMISILMGFLLYVIAGQILTSNSIAKRTDAWVQVIYPLGLLILILSPFIIWLKDSRTVFFTGFWYGGVIVIAVASLAFAVSRFFTQLLSQARSKLETRKFFQSTVNIVQRAGTLTWLKSISLGVVRIIESFTRLLSRILEGDGGLLWSFLLFILVLTLVKAGVK